MEDFDKQELKGIRTIFIIGIVLTVVPILFIIYRDNLTISIESYGKAFSFIVLMLVFGLIIIFKGFYHYIKFRKGQKTGIRNQYKNSPQIEVNKYLLGQKGPTWYKISIRLFYILVWAACILLVALIIFVVLALNWNYLFM